MLFGQKKVLTHKDYDHWNALSGQTISKSGRYVTWQVKPQKGDGQLYIYDRDLDKKFKFNRGYKARLTYDEQYLVFQVKPPYSEARKAELKGLKKAKKPQDKLVVFHLRKNTIDSLGYVSAFKLPKESGGILAVKEALYYPEEKKEAKPIKEGDEEVEKEEKGSKKKKDPHWYIYELDDQTERVDSILHVSELQFAETSAQLFYSLSHKKHDSIKGVFLYSERAHTLLDSAGTTFKKLTVSKSGQQAAWISTKDSTKAEVKRFELRMYQNGKVLNHEGIGAQEVVSSGMTMSESQSIQFSEDEVYLYFDVQALAKASGKDTNLLESERVRLDIWNWKDTIIQPTQKKQLKSGGRPSYTCARSNLTGKVTQLENSKLQRVRYDLKYNRPQLVGFDDRKNRRSSTWTYPIPKDVYLVDMTSGERELILADHLLGVSYSPSGKYLYWYDSEVRTWWALSLEARKKVKLNTFKTSITKEDHDLPSMARPYGVGGWSEDDGFVYIYDRYDIWKVDPQTGEHEQITKGRKEELSHRMYTIDKEKNYLGETELMIVINRKTGRQSFYSLNLKNGQTEVLLEDQPFSYKGLIKAKEEGVMVYRKGNFVGYPELYVSDITFKGSKKLSETNPQQKEYNWGTAELVEYKAASFGKQKALLYKPENFDPNKKYPVILYFYEKYSNLLHNHFGFAPSRSTINFAYFTSNGYIVMVPDIAYEVGAPGQSALKCVNGAADWLEKQSYVDSKRIGIQGQSWGGYQVAYIITQTNRFACGMAGAPVSNMTSAYGGIRWGSGWSRMLQYETGQSRIGKNLWEDYESYYKNSPLFFADRVQTPLLMMHNDQDGAVPWYQGIEYFMALRRLDKPAWMLVYNKEDHNLKGWYNRVDISIRMSDFFGHYLKGEAAPDWMTKGVKAINKEGKNGLQLLDE